MGDTLNNQHGVKGVDILQLNILQLIGMEDFRTTLSVLSRRLRDRQNRPRPLRLPHVPWGTTWSVGRADPTTLEADQWLFSSRPHPHRPGHDVFPTPTRRGERSG